MVTTKCKRPPPDWYCNGEENHSGPCAAWPRSWKQRIKWAWKCKTFVYLFKREKS